ncbi:hypothetical protein QBC46DRAFT_395446 [Diplogelasinospora grovesii]|uniref:Methyltransferase type 11 domain-containing protein n=1 Tax=Diplogelasinospora grovesii TaxID=303347 RepID=A0AAN6N2Q8_9PEZI|nr:hypothetical protein QBC46DRAFT_395446 [Diplogelasinospora grovesii]
MSDLILLPNTAYRPPSSQSGRRMARTLNPIIEEPDQSKERDTRNTHSVLERRRKNRQSIEKIEQWLSPLSDHFPTPRGMHFLAAPILPSTPSCISSDCDGDIDDASSEASSSDPSTKMWNKRESVMTDVTEFDDLYDVSDEERRRKSILQANGISRQRSSVRSSRSQRRGSRASIESRKALAPLVIPEDLEPAAPNKKCSSPVPPTPPSTVEMSPAIKSYMEARQAQEIPRISAPPSLDGSMNSEDMASMSAPPTPLIGAQASIDEDWSGVRLQPGALETLQALSGSESEYEEEPARVIEVPQEMLETRQQLPRLITALSAGRASAGPSPATQRSLASLSKLEIPSPGGFFSDLSSASRLAWNAAPSQSGDESAPPTSTTAENFYKTPWSHSSENLPPPPPPPRIQRARPLHLDDLPSAIVERVVEIPGAVAPEDLPTAVRIQPTPEPITARRVPPVGPVPPTPRRVLETTLEEAPPTAALVEVTEIVADYGYDATYAKQQQQTALTHLDRTEMWLMAQQSYLKGVVGFQGEEAAPAEEAKPDVSVSDESGSELEQKKPEVPPKDIAASTPVSSVPAHAVTTESPKKKAVRFSEAVIKASVPKKLPPKLSRLESAYYRAFADATVRSCPGDVFVHRQPRFEALQAQRVSLKDSHRSQLLGKYQLSVVPQSAKKRMSANVARGDDIIVDDPDKLKADKEAEALGQMHMSNWHVAATKILNGGCLIAAPIAKRLARQSRMAPDPLTGVSRDRARILDLGGQGACDWAWHAALQYPNTKIYTVTTKQIRQLSNSNIRGPPNHRQVAVERLTRLPFADDQFDLVSARELHSILKLCGENGVDEWDACLRECMRVLKPGGYLEFSVMDADVMNAGPLGNAKAVEFGFALQTLGYDPNPTRSFLGRLNKAGFEEVRRAWMCLPMGPRKPTKRPPVPSTVVQMDAIVAPEGSTDNVAAITGLAAGWSWERWLLRAEMEKAAGESRLAVVTETVGAPGEVVKEAGKTVAEVVHKVVEEGREMGSGFRMLRGYTKKPNFTGLINMVLDTDSF